MKKIVIIGAGAAGLMAAVTAAENGNKVTILEHKESLGRKLKVTGNGKCNFTNIYMDEACYGGNDKEFIKAALNEFDVKKTIEYFETIGMSFAEKNGYVYPRSETAASVVEFFEEKCKLLGISIIYKAEVKKITGGDNDFTVHYILDGNRMEIPADKVIIAAGSKAAPKTGSDGSGYYFAKTLGHNVITPVPGLVGLKVKEEFVKNLAGLRATGSVKLYKEGKVLSEDTGEIQFTAYGISGIPVFQVSRYAATELVEKADVSGCLDMFVEKSEEELADYIMNKASLNSDYSISLIFKTVFNSKLFDELLRLFDIDGAVSVKCIDKERIRKIVHFIKNIPVTITDTNGFNNAQVCAGGVDTKEVHAKTMESKLVKGVYFAGEVLDVDGKCGGYNLQWAWTSGRLAGRDVGK